jgi:hypothetical protein
MMTTIYNKNRLSSSALSLNPISDRSYTVPSTSTQSQAQALPATEENINSTSLPTYIQQTNDTITSPAINKGSKRMITSSQVDGTSRATKRFSRH